jgi:hypothetical protein
MLSKRDWEARRALVGGMLLSPGFGALLKSPNKNFFNGSFIKQQVDEAGLFDIYILWASTNDYTNHRAVGTYTDYTEFDSYDEGKLLTQAGGINYCIKKIYELNPNAIIYFFTSSKDFNDQGGYDPFYAQGMNQYVEIQKKSL